MLAETAKDVIMNHALGTATDQIPSQRQQVLSPVCRQRIVQRFADMVGELGDRGEISKKLSGGEKVLLERVAADPSVDLHQVCENILARLFPATAT